MDDKNRIIEASHPPLLTQSYNDGVPRSGSARDSGQRARYQPQLLRIIFKQFVL